MKTRLSIAIALCLTASATMALTPVAPPQLYVDQGWTVLFEAMGDLNKDGIDDRAVIVEAPEAVTEPPAGCEGEEDYSDAPVRRLVVTFLDSDGGETLAADEPATVMRSDMGGVMGDPLMDLRIERGAIVLEDYGGSRHRWGDVIRFRFDDSQWRLIGWTNTYTDTAGPHVVVYDYNPLTEKMLRTIDIPPPEEGSDDFPGPFCTACLIGEKCPEVEGACYEGTKRRESGETWFTIGKRDPIPMAGLLCWQEKVGFLKHLGFEDGR